MEASKPPFTCADADQVALELGQGAQRPGRYELPPVCGTTP